MLNRREWFDLLHDIYRDCRDFPGWPDIYECHDDEDRKYFMGLDELSGR